MTFLDQLNGGPERIRKELSPKQQKALLLIATTNTPDPLYPIHHQVPRTLMPKKVLASLEKKDLIYSVRDRMGEESHANETYVYVLLSNLGNQVVQAIVMAHHEEREARAIEFSEVTDVEKLLRYATQREDERERIGIGNPMSDTLYLLNAMSVHDLVRLATRIPAVVDVEVSVEEDISCEDYTDAAEVLRAAFANMVRDFLKETR